jgi:hypothetical protein
MPVKQFAPTYDAAVLSMLDQAYSAACRELDIDPNPSDPALNKDLREALAKAIVDMAATGLRDPRTLRLRALQAIAKRGASRR